LVFSSPDDEYIFVPEKIGLRALAEKWEISFSTIRARSKRGSWVERREVYQRGVMEETVRKFKEVDSKRRTKILEDAAERHMQEGRELQDTAEQYRIAGLARLLGKTKCPHCGGEVPVPKDKVKSTDAFRAAVQGVGKGVEVERKALGIADRVEVEYRTTEIVREVIQVLEVVITDPDVMAEAVYRLQQIGKKDREKLARITAGGEMVESKL
jgi:hypothetical protein